MNNFQAMKETGLERALLLTYDQSEQMQINNKKIDIIPVYQWLLGK